MIRINQTTAVNYARISNIKYDHGKVVVSVDGELHEVDETLLEESLLKTEIIKLKKKASPLEPSREELLAHEGG